MSEIQGKIPSRLTCYFARPHAEMFAGARDDKPSCSGYAATFDAYSEDLGGYRTKIAPGCFDRVLQGDPDTRFLVNHDSNLLFGRTKNGTLRLKADDKGLYFDVDPPDTPLWQHYATAIGRGDLDGCSFHCDVDIDQWDFSGETAIRTLISVSSLFDVGPVTFPAFPQTDVSASFALEAARREASDRIEAAARRGRRARALSLLVSLGP